MPLHDTDALIIDTSGGTEALPDPTTVAGRTHHLSNGNTGPVTWTSSGPALPFTVDGVAVAALTVPAGRSRRVQSVGGTWVAEPAVSASARRTAALTGVTGSNGQVTFTFTPPFATVPVVAATAQPGALGANGHFTEVLSVSASGCTVQGWQGRGVLLGGQTTELSGAGVTVHLLATEAGQGV